MNRSETALKNIRNNAKVWRSSALKFRVVLLLILPLTSNLSVVHAPDNPKKGTQTIKTKTIEAIRKPPHLSFGHPLPRGERSEGLRMSLSDGIRDSSESSDRTPSEAGVRVKNPSALQLAQSPSAFTIRTSTPRIITPNGDTYNDFFDITFDNPAQNLVTQKKIYDLTGAEVADFEVVGGDETADPIRLRWNGKNTNGEIVRSGVYVYQVQAEGKVITGTIVVAR